MNAARRVAMIFGFVGWIYSWYLIRGIRNEYSPGDIGKMPPWLLLLMVATSTFLIGTSVTAGLRLPVWPFVSAGGGLLLMSLIFLGQLSVMRSAAPTQTPSISDAVRAALRVRTPFGVAVFVAGIPTVLVLSGITGVARGPAPADGGLGGSSRPEVSPARARSCEPPESVEAADV